MSPDQKLTPRLESVLKAISNYIQEFGKPPYHYNQKLVEETGYSSNNITNIKSELRALNFVNGDSDLTSVGKEYIRKYFGPFIVSGVEVRVQGSVRAGPKNELFADFDRLDRPSKNTKTIPDVSSETDTFALVVQGQSMTELGIFPNDLVIVEYKEFVVARASRPYSYKIFTSY